MPSEEFETLCEQARKAVRRRDLSEAVATYSQAIALFPDDAAAHEGLATAHFLAQEYDQAIVHFQRVTQLKPRDARAYINLGALYNLKRDYQKAADILRKGIQRDGKSPDAYYNLGIAQKHLNQLAMAMSAYKECVKLKPEMAEAHVNLANCYVEQKNYKKAIEHYKLSLNHRPNFNSALRGLAHVRRLMDQSRQSDAPFGRLVDTSKLVSKDTDVAGARVLTDDERFDDRRFVQLTTAESLELSERFWNHLRDHLEPVLLSVGRVMAQDLDQQRALFNLRDDFHQSLRFAEKTFSKLQAEFHKLKEHQQAMK